MIRLTKIAALLVFVVLAALAMAPSTPAQIAVGVWIRVGPPALPVYAQPIALQRATSGPRILGIRSIWLLLGAGHVGTGACAGPALDPRILGLGRGRLCLARRILGPSRRILWRN